jgi:GT2 family glycosyltransferase
MAVPSSRFRAVGGFDEAFFVYAEDMALGRRGRQAGFRSVLREDVVVAHNAGGSGAPSSEMLRMRGASFAYYVIRYHSRFSAQLMRAILAGGSLLRAARSRWAKNASEARLHVEFTKGTLTRRAFVNGSEVSGRRYREVVGRERVDVLSEEPKG